MGSGLAPGGDVQPWWKNWQRKQEFQMEIEEELLRKNFDIPKAMPLRDVNSNNTTNKGIGAFGALGIAALAAAIPGSALLYQSLNPAATEAVEKLVPGPPGKETHKTTYKTRDKTVEVEIIPPK